MDENIGATGPVKLFSDDIANSSSGFNKHGNEESKVFLSSPEDVNKFFEINRCKNWVCGGGFTKVALQFPDNYLQYSFDVAQSLESPVTKIYILGDTSYGSCCVDYITAEHANCDAIIHFGDACMSATVGKLPILYIFGKHHVDCATLLSELQHKTKANDGEVAVLLDSEFHNQIEELQATVSSVFPRAKTFFLDSHENDGGTSSHADAEVILRRRVPKCVREWRDATLVFVGAKSSALLPIWLMTFSEQFCTVLHYIPKTGTVEVDRPMTSRLLRKRLYLMEKLRDANSVGLVIGTMAVHGFRDAVARTRQLCQAAGKRLYVFSIGKINEAKLSNFADHVDAFVLLSCPFGIILNTGDYYKPIVSLYESEIALNSDKDWFTSTGWTSEFAGFVDDPIGKTDKETSDVSLITGRIRAMKPMEDEAQNVAGMQVIQYAAGDYFANRSWKGLDDTSSTTTGEIRVKPGLDGVAVDYGEAGR